MSDNRLEFTANWMNAYIIAIIIGKSLTILEGLIPEPQELVALWDMSDEGPLKEILSLVLEGDPFSPETVGTIRGILIRCLDFSEPALTLDRTEKVL